MTIEVPSGTSDGDPEDPPTDLLEEVIEPELLKEIPEPARDALRLSIKQLYFEAHAGPLPPPAQLQQYERVLTGAADRIVTMAEKQQAHRQELEATVVKGGAKRANLGLWLGFIISVVVIGVGATLVMTGHEVAGITLIGVDLVALAGVFVYGRRDQRKERVAKAEAVAEAEVRAMNEATMHTRMVERNTQLQLPTPE